MRRIAHLVLAAVVALFATESLADEVKAEKTPPATLEELRERVEKLEGRVRDGVVTDELGHKYHPIHSIYGLKIGGGLTLIGQGAGHLKNGKSRGALTLSGDIALESPVGKAGRAVAVLDFQSGSGLNNLPSFFSSPNGNASGPNADIESFNNDQLHMTQLYYEHEFGNKAAATIGKLDPTAYFDSNNFANNERSQFIANIFTNNAAIEFGGSPDFYSPGLRVTYAPHEALNLSAGIFEGDGDFSNSFDSPFVIAEADFKHSHGEMEGNLRVYYWQRASRPDVTTAADPGNPALAKEKNSGVGVSLDHMVTESIGLWLRAGTQKEKVAQFDRHLSAGIHAEGLFGRENDRAGIGYGATFMGKDYEDFQKAANPAFKSATEHYMEAYYNIAVDGATDITGLHISPDVQYIRRPGGDEDAGEVFIYGLRLQAFF